MKKSINQKLMSCLMILAVITLSFSCKKDKDQRIPPTINFKTTAGYTYADCTLSTNDTIYVGINAAFAEGKDYLTRFVVGQSYDGGSSTTWYQESFNNEEYSHDMYIYTRSIPGVEKYTFTIINRDGLVTTISLTITVV